MTRKELANELLSDETRLKEQVLVYDASVHSYELASGVSDLSEGELKRAKAQYKSYQLDGILDSGAVQIDLM